MLTALRLGNFKAFAETQRIPIKPLTLIFGPNSAGKSSILHGLLLARHALDTGDLDVHRTTIGGQSVDLGGFRQYVHRRQTRSLVEWGIELESDKLPPPHREIFAGTRTLTVSVQIGLRHIEKMTFDNVADPVARQRSARPTGELVAIGNPHVQQYEIATDDQTFLRMSRRGDAAVEEALRAYREGRLDLDAARQQARAAERSGHLQLDILNQEHPAMQALFRQMVEATSTTALSEADVAALRTAIDDLVPAIWAEEATFLPGKLYVSGASEAEPAGRAAAATPMFFPISRARRREDLIEAMRYYLPRALSNIVDWLRVNAEGLLDGLLYLGPVRARPPRHIALRETNDANWDAGGGYAWDVLRKDDRVRAEVNQWLGKLEPPYEVVVQEYLSTENLKDTLAREIEQIPVDVVEEGHEGGRYPNGHEYDAEPPTYGIKDPDTEAARLDQALREAAADRPREPVLIDRRRNTMVWPCDVGTGISQVVPVLVAAASTEAKVHAIEQSEIHLHPALQAELGDVLIRSALGERKNVFLLETHSEHLILRVMRRIRETTAGKLPAELPPVRPEDVCVLYVETDGTRSIVREMPLNERGELVKAWPGGFFEEDYRELFG